LSPAIIARRVRLSGRTDSAVYPGLTGGVMPFWSEDRLSDPELRDLIAWLPTTQMDTPNKEPVGRDISVTGAQQACGSTHPLVGKKATLSTFSHQVTGTVEVVDDCTLRFTGFRYDGGGIDVRIYGGRNGQYRGGPTLSRDILGSRFNVETVTLRLPPTVTLSDFDGLSVWCVAVGVSFGDGLFR
jgi:hypothetical protein